MSNINWEKIGKIVNSEGFKTGIGVVGAGISASANAKTNAANSAQQASQYDRTLAANQGNQATSQRTNAAIAAANASPLGANEDYAHRNALRLAVLSGMRNPSVVATDPGVRAATPQITSPFQIPAGGFSAATLAHLTPQATAGAIAQRQKAITNIDPHAPGIDFSRMGFGQDAIGGLQDETDGYQTALAGSTSDADKLQAALMQQPLPAAKPKKKGGILSKLGHIAKVAVPIVLAATGVGAPAAAAIMAGTYAASKKADGGSWGDSLKSGVIGGAAGGIGAGALGGAGGASMDSVSQAGLGLGKAATSAATKAAAMKAGQNLAQDAAGKLIGGGQQPVTVQPAPSASAQAQMAGVDPRILAAALRRQQFSGR